MPADCSYRCIIIVTVFEIIALITTYSNQACHTRTNILARHLLFGDEYRIFGENETIILCYLTHSSYSSVRKALPLSFFKISLNLSIMTPTNKFIMKKAVMKMKTTKKSAQMGWWLCTGTFSYLLSMAMNI